MAKQIKINCKEKDTILNVKKYLLKTWQYTRQK